jgi:hypothetical protein
MKFTSNQIDYRIRFQYSLAPNNHRRVFAILGIKGNPGEPLETLSCGVATLHPNDVFDKELGRRLALKRALQGLPRTLRSLAWGAYWGRK